MTISKPLEYNGHTYPLSKAATWTEAQAEAKSLGGNLVTIKIGFIALALCLSLGITQNANADFSDDFSAGNLDKWVLNSPTGGEFSVSDGELLQTNTSPGGLNREIVAKDGNSWSDYTLSFKARVVSGFYSVTSFDIFFRLQNQPTSGSSSYGHPGYFFQLHGGGQVNLFKIDSSGNLVLIQTSSKTIVTPNYTGYQVKITAIGDTIKVYVDDVLMIDTIDSTYKSGSIGFSTVHFVGAYDDVKVIDEKPTADLKDGLVAHWSFDDCSAKDNSGNGHDGTLNGNPQCVDGVKGKAFSFDGVSDDIRVPTSKDFNVETNASYSLWINPKVSKGIIFRKVVNGAEDKSMGFDANGKVYFYLFNCMSENPLITQQNIPLNQWSHISATYDGISVKIYINGVLDASVNTTTSCNIADNSGFFGIGSDAYYEYSQKKYLQGETDDLRIYNRALTEAEVMALYNAVAQPKETVQISGQVKLGTQAGKGVTLSGDGLTEECLTDATGKFNCKIEKGWTGLLTPESKGVKFSPSQISVTNSQTNLEVKTELVGTTTDIFPLNGVMTPDWVNKTMWEVETSNGTTNDKTAYEGYFSFGSAKISANQAAAIETTINVTQAGQVSFARRVSSNPEHGVLNFEIIGRQKNGTWKTLVSDKWSGDVAWDMKNYALSVGRFKLRWTYTKDGAEAEGEDKAWIDAVSYPSSVKNCEGITAGTVKLMAIKNPTCGQLQAYAVWLKTIRPSRLKEAGIYSSKITGIEKDNEWWQNFVSYSGMAAGFFSPFNPLSSDVAVERVTDVVFGSMLNESIGIICDKAIADPVYSSVCGVGQELLISAVTETLKQFATGTAISGWAVAPYALEQTISFGFNLRYAWSADDVAFNLNNTNLADDFLDEYYKGGSNNAALKAMAKKYGAKNTALSTLVDAIANQKGYYNAFYGNEYSNEIVVNNIESVKNLNTLTIKNFFNK